MIIPKSNPECSFAKSLPISFGRKAVSALRLFYDQIISEATGNMEPCSDKFLPNIHTHSGPGGRLIGL